MSSIEFISREKVLDMVVIASLAVFSVMSKAPLMIVVSSSVSSPPFPAWKVMQIYQDHWHIYPKSTQEFSQNQLKNFPAEMKKAMLRYNQRIDIQTKVSPSLTANPPTSLAVLALGVQHGPSQGANPATAKFKVKTHDWSPYHSRFTGSLDRIMEFMPRTSSLHLFSFFRSMLL